MVACPACRYNYSKPFIKDRSGYFIVSCDKCKHVFFDFKPIPDHVSKIYSDDYFKGGKSCYADYIALEPLLIKRGIHYSNIIGSFVEPGDMLDVG